MSDPPCTVLPNKDDALASAATETGKHLYLTAFELPESVALRMDRDRQFGHRAVMSLFPDGLGSAPRAEAGALWHMDFRGKRLTVQHQIPMLDEPAVGVPTKLEPPVTWEVGERVAFALDVECTYTPSPDIPMELRPLLKATGSYRSRREIVPEDHRPDWLVAMLGRRGFSVELGGVQIDPLGRVSLGRRGGLVPYVSCRVEAMVADPAAARAAVVAGIGRAKNFGLGMARMQTPSQER